MRTCRIALVVVTLAAPAAGQEDSPAPVSELELGGGWLQWNPFELDDLVTFPSGPSVTLSRAVWRSESRGFATGVTAVLGRVERWSVERAHPVYAHGTYRWRWRLSDPRNTVHFGLGGGFMVWRLKNRVRQRDSPLSNPVYRTRTKLSGFFMYHVELFLTRPVRDGLDFRAGVTFTPLLWVPLRTQPVLMGVWRF